MLVLLCSAWSLLSMLRMVGRDVCWGWSGTGARAGRRRGGLGLARRAPLHPASPFSVPGGRRRPPGMENGDAGCNRYVGKGRFAVVFEPPKIFWRWCCSHYLSGSTDGGYGRLCLLEAILEARRSILKRVGDLFWKRGAFVFGKRNRHLRLHGGQPIRSSTDGGYGGLRLHGGQPIRSSTDGGYGGLRLPQTAAMGILCLLEAIDSFYFGSAEEVLSFWEKETDAPDPWALGRLREGSTSSTGGGYGGQSAIHSFCEWSILEARRKCVSFLGKETHQKCDVPSVEDRYVSVLCGTSRVRRGLGCRASSDKLFLQISLKIVRASV